MRLRTRTPIALAVSLVALCTATAAWAAPSASADFGLRSIGGELVAGNSGVVGNQAGAHPAETIVNFDFNSEQKNYESGTATVPDGALRTSVTELPPGLIGNPTAIPYCSTTDFEQNTPREPACPADTQVGIAEITFTGFTLEPILQYSQIYNLKPLAGEPARFGGRIAKSGAEAAAVILDASVRTGEGPGSQYGITLTDSNVPSAIPILGAKVTFWGNPYDSSHDGLRAGCVDVYEPTGNLCPVETTRRPAFVSTPTSCTGAPLGAEQSIDSWERPGAFLRYPFAFQTAGAPAVLGGCERLRFGPSFTATPTSTAAESPTGLDLDLHLPQSEEAAALATSSLRDATFELPEGMTVNPSAANGLGSCSASQIELAGSGQANPAACPDGAKLGTVEIDSPLVGHTLAGSIYLAKQGENKYGSLLAIYLAIDDPQTGVVIKIPGKISTNAQGRLTASFEDAPQLPFEDLHASFFGGADAALMTPPACGTYSVGATFTPWSGTAAVRSESSFTIATGPGGSACPSGGFQPTFSAGVANPAAGQFSSFLLAVGRADGSQRLSSVAATLPQGLLAKLAGVPYCSDAALAGISGNEGTAAVQASSPSCPAASRVGTVTVGAGAGPSPFYLDTGRVYLAGPYAGAPLSLAVVTPALAGPFDLGNVVVRVALRVDPTTTQVTAVSDPLPTVLHGIPLDLRDVRVSLDRPQFIVNPTSCAAKQIDAAITGVAGATATPSTPFAVAGCAGLGFGPKLGLVLSGATKRTGNPALRAELNARPGDANIGRVRVVLPASEFIDQSHVSNPCTRVQFAADQCPASSVLGQARAFSPLLDQPLEGPVYFRSNGGERQLPDIVADLHGQIDVVVVGFIDSAKKKGSNSSRVRTTFASVPDAPISKFVLNLAGGKRGLLENSVDLCKKKQRATVSALGQNGRSRDFTQPLRTKGCGGKS